MLNKKRRYDIEEFTKALGVSTEEMAGLFSSYIAEMEGEIAEMQAQLAKKDWKMLQRVVHNIKGVSGNLHINDVYKEAFSFDIMLKEGDTGAAHEHVERLVKLITGSEIEIREYFFVKGFTI